MERQRIAIGPSEQERIGYIFRPAALEERPCPAALLIHGWESAQDRMFGLAAQLVARGFICLTLDLRGHGESSGDRDALSRKDFFADVVAAYDTLAAENAVDRPRIGAVGSSFGGHLAAMLSAERPLAWVILRVPADYPDDTFEVPRAQDADSKLAWRSQPRAWEETAAMRAMHAFEGPVLIVEAGNDELVPRQLILNYKSAIGENAEHQVIEGAPHSFTRFPHFQERFNAMVEDWLARKV